MLKNSIRVKGFWVFTILTILLLSGCGSSGGDGGVAPVAPTGVAVSSGAGELTVTWNAVSGASTYNLYYTSVPGVTKTNYASLSNGTTLSGVSAPLIITGLINDTTYYLVVTAVNAYGESIESTEVSATFQYSVDCSSSATYSPAIPPEITLSTGTPATTSVIVMHGKTGLPLSEHLLPLYTDLSNAGYDVIAPYMPWSGLVWDGSMCEAMNYIDSLAAQEAAKGRNVVVAGHSMGGAHALIYGVTTPSNEVKAIVTMAPGHFPHILPEMQTDTAQSIALAEDMVASGNGDSLATFFIRRSGEKIQITASANDYLSYHALYQYPDVNDVIPAIELPVLWLSGDTDTLTTYIDMAGLASRLTNPDSDYQVVSGDHKEMVSSSGAPIDTWLKSLGI